MDVNGVTTIADLLAKYGVLAVLFAVFVVIIVVAFKLLTQYVHNSLETIKSQNEAYIKKLSSPIVEPTILDEHIEYNEIISSHLRHLRDATDADRAFICMFHNTAYGIGGFPFLKVSLVYEWALSTVPALISKPQNVPVFLLREVLVKLGAGKTFLMPDIIDSVHETPALFALMKESGARGFAAAPIQCQVAGIVGYVGVDYIGVPIDKASEANILKELKETAEAVAPILCKQGGKEDGTVK